MTKRSIIDKVLTPEQLKNSGLVLEQKGNHNLVKYSLGNEIYILKKLPGEYLISHWNINKPKT